MVEPVVPNVDAAAVPSADAALTEFQASATTEPVAPAEPAADAPVAPVDDVDALLSDVPVIDPAAPVDPLEALKDNPRVVELVAAETELKGFRESLAGLPYAVSNPEEMKGQLTDAHALYDVVMGKAPASQLLDMMLQNPHWGEPQKQAVLADLAKKISEITGKPVAANAAGIEDPAMAKVSALEKQLQQRDQREATAKLNQRMADGRTKAAKQLEALTKGSFLEGEDVLPELGKLLAGKEQQVLESIEKGDFKIIEDAFKTFKKQEVDRFKRYNTRLIAMKKAKDAALPKQTSGGQPTGSPTNKIDLSDQNARIEHGVAMLRQQQ